MAKGRVLSGAGVAGLVEGQEAREVWDGFLH